MKWYYIGSIILALTLITLFAIPPLRFAIDQQYAGWGPASYTYFQCDAQGIPSPVFVQIQYSDYTDATGFDARGYEIPVSQNGYAPVIRANYDASLENCTPTSREEHEQARAKQPHREALVITDEKTNEIMGYRIVEKTENSVSIYNFDTLGKKTYHRLSWITENGIQQDVFGEEIANPMNFSYQLLLSNKAPTWLLEFEVEPFWIN